MNSETDSSADGIMRYIRLGGRLVVKVTAHQPTDSDLIRQILKGNRSVYAELVERYKRLVYTIAYRMTGRTEDAEDLTQEVFLPAYAALPRFQLSRPFAPWISRIVSNLCLNWLDRQKREQWASGERDQHYSVSAEEIVQSNELDQALQQAILRLPPRYRLVFTLRYLEEHDCRQVAEIMEIPEGTVKTYLYRARQKLQKELRHFWHEES